MADLNREELRRLAQLGAKARLAELERETAAIRRAFPGLGARAADGMAVSRRRRSGMSAAARKAVSVRMKKYWAERRKAKK